jgi:hypothetical protein
MRTLTNPPQAAIATAAAANAETAPPLQTVWDTGTGYVYVRQPWDATYDVVLVFARSDGGNANIKYQSVGLLAIATESGGTPSLTSVHSISDSTAQLYTNARGRVGGAHTCQIPAITKAGHGRTSADIGKRYQGSDGQQYAITAVPDANTLWLIGQPKTISGDSYGTYYLPTAATTLTGLDGLSDLTGWTAAYTDPGPPVNALQLQFYVDGRVLLAGQPPMTCSRLDLVEYHEAPDLGNAFSYFTTTGASATWANAGNMWKRMIRYTVHPWAQVEIEDCVILDYATRFEEAGPIQSEPLGGYGSATNMHQWIPGAASVTFTGTTINSVASPTLNFNAPVFVGGTCSGSTMYLENAAHSVLTGGAFPDWNVQLCSASTSSHAAWTSSHLAGLDPTFENGTPTKFAENAKEWWKLQPSTRKSYSPTCLSKDTTRPAGTYRHRAFRRWTPPPASSPVDFWTFVKAGEKWLVYAAWTTNPGSFTLTLPSYLRDKVASLVRGHNATLTSTSSAGGSLVIASTAANGHAIIQLG